ncbi:hypothetical protein E3N88_26166 [Mikania micrantha]|uniref:Tf2-1-like SH3-like domain-containing protein n=1 Tax=Mikania micrantha TaxID=192012 RepID=A0A5N6N7C2_9ASTR|nr:hypothetical protein E3N88_26166 [Mikania micrantha]
MDKRRKPLEFQVGDRVLLKVSPWKGVIRFGKRGKLNPRYIGPFEITKRIGPVAYELNLPVELSSVHNVFHISNLKKCLSDETLVIPLEEIQIDEQLNFVEEPVEIMDGKTRSSNSAKSQSPGGTPDPKHTTTGDAPGWKLSASSGAPARNDGAIPPTSGVTPGSVARKNLYLSKKIISILLYTLSPSSSVIIRLFFPNPPATHPWKPLEAIVAPLEAWER